MKKNKIKEALCKLNITQREFGKYKLLQEKDSNLSLILGKEAEKCDIEKFKYFLMEKISDITEELKKLK